VIQRSRIIKTMTDEEILAACRADSPLARVRAVLYENLAVMEHESAQGPPKTPLENRRQELQIANEICALFGIGLP